jgi:transglutaminase-like putative cysteine protease
MNLTTAADMCRESGLFGWELVEFAQHLVNRNMKYSVENSLDLPPAAFEKGKGYCWHQASALNVILRELGFNSRLVHAFRNRFQETEIMGVTVHDLVSGHVWCRVAIDGVEKDVCPGSGSNAPGSVHFIPLGKVREWGKGIEFLTYYGAALFNYHRRNKYGKAKKKEI